MMDPVEASAFGGFALEAMDALKTAFGPDVRVANSIFIVEVENGDETTVWLYSTEKRTYVQNALLTEAMKAKPTRRVHDDS